MPGKSKAITAKHAENPRKGREENLDWDTTVLYTFTKALARPIEPIGEWNTMDTTMDGPHTIVQLNAVKVTDFIEGQTVPPKPVGSHDPDRGPRSDSGFIGLQNHPGSEVYFKEGSVVPISR